ncbi:radical SAM protein [bacterium]|nr:radical SAM protein [bacterium]
MNLLFLNLPYDFEISRASRWPEKTKSRTLYYPYWLAYAAGVAEAEGLNTDLIDAIPRKWDRQTAVDHILSSAPDLVIGETTTPTLHYDLDFIRQLKAAGFRGKVALGGTHITVLYEETLKSCPELDFALVGEYDRTVPELADALDNPEPVHGVAFLKADGTVRFAGRRPVIEDLDTLPFVSEVYRKYLDVRDYFYGLAQHPMIQILSSRGCPFRCSFCQYPQTMGGRTYRVRSPENVVAELEFIGREMPEIREIFIEDDTFTVDKKRVERICDLILEKQLKLVWSCNARADVPYETLAKMKAAGCRLLVVGYESGNEGILKNIEKGITLKQSREFAKAAKKLGLRVFGCFIVGLTGETRETIEETFHFARETDADMVFFQQAVPFPGTEFYRSCETEGMLRTRDFSQWMNAQGHLACLVDYAEFPHTELEKIRDRLMVRYHFSPVYILKTLVRNPSLREISRIMKSGIGYLAFRTARLFGKK